MTTPNLERINGEWTDGDYVEVLINDYNALIDRVRELEEAVKEAAYMIEGIADVHDPNCLWQDDGPCDCHKERAENWSSKYGKGE